MRVPGVIFRFKVVFLCLLLLFIFLYAPLSDASIKVNLKDIRYKSFKDYTRITIYLSGPVEFSKNRISKPERLYFDLENTTLPKKVKANFNVGDKVLKAVRTRQFNKDTVRVVLDLERAEDFKVSLLSKPVRLVIDIYSFKPQKKKPDIVPPLLAKKPDVISPLTKETKVITEIPVKIKEDDFISSGERYIKLGEYEKALHDFRKAAELNPSRAETYVSIGHSLFKLEEKEKAIESYKQALIYNPNSADAYNGLGYAYYTQGKAGSAVDAFLMAIKINPEHDDARAGLGYTYLTTGDIKSAIEQYRVLKSLDSNKADDLFHLIFKAQTKEQTKILSK